MSYCFTRRFTPMSQPISRLMHTSRPPQYKAPSLIQTLHVSNHERDAFKREVASTRQSPYTHYKTLAPHLGEIFKCTISSDIYCALREVALHETVPVLLLKNCPLNCNPGPTPETDNHTPQKGFVEEFFSLGMMRAMFGKPFHDKAEKQGEVIGQINAVKGYETEKSSRGTSADFEWHSEHVHLSLEEGVHFLSLFCIKGDPNATTKLLPVETCIKDLPNWVKEGLQRSAFRMQTGPSWRSSKVSRISPILQPDGIGGFNMQYNHDLINRLIGEDEGAAHVLDYFSKHVNDIEPEGVVLENGDCLIINNKKVLHRRDAYQISTSWEDRRWLQRLYMQIDYSEIVKEIFKKTSPKEHLTHRKV